MSCASVAARQCRSVHRRPVEFIPRLCLATLVSHIVRNAQSSRFFRLLKDHEHTGAAVCAEGVDPYKTTAKKRGPLPFLLRVLLNVQYCIIIGPYIELVFCIEHH